MPGPGTAAKPGPRRLPRQRQDGVRLPIRQKEELSAAKLEDEIDRSQEMEGVGRGSGELHGASEIVGDEGVRREAESGEAPQTRVEGRGGQALEPNREHRRLGMGERRMRDGDVLGLEQGGRVPIDLGAGLRFLNVLLELLLLFYLILELTLALTEKREIEKRKKMENII